MAKKILIVEDEADIRSLYTEVLKDAGFDVIEAADGNEALDKALNNDWDVLLLDIILPGHDGVNILKTIKTAERTKSRPVILLTNLGVEHIINECFQIGAEGYLIKSEITPDKIVSEITNLLPKSSNA